MIHTIPEDVKPLAVSDNFSPIINPGWYLNLTRPANCQKGQRYNYIPVWVFFAVVFSVFCFLFLYVCVLVYIHVYILST